MAPIKWLHMLAGAGVAGITNYMVLAFAGQTGKLAILSGILGGLSYIVAYIQNPEKAPPLPEPPRPKP